MFVSGLSGSIIPSETYAACPTNMDTSSTITVGSGDCVWSPTGDVPGLSSASIDRAIGWTTYLKIGRFAGASGYNTLTMNGDVTMNIVPSATIREGANITGISVTSPSASLPGGTPGDGATSSMTATGNLILNMNNSAAPTANVSATGIIIDYNGQFIGSDVIINVRQNIQADIFGFRSPLYSYGILAGGSVNDGNYDTGHNAYARFNNLMINIDSTSSNGLGSYLNTMAGIRAVAQTTAPGSSGYNSGFGTVVITGMTTIKTAGNYSVGIYVSGRDSLVDLNDSSITTAGSTSSAIKLGKTRAGGNGGGTLLSRGHMDIDTTAADAASILLLGNVDPASGYSPATLNADFSTSSTRVKSAMEAVNYTIDDKGTSGSGNDVSASFNNAQMWTTSPTASLIKVEGNANYAQTGAVFNLRGDRSLLTGADDGWLFEVQNHASLTANIRQAEMYGLVTTGGTGTFMMNLSDDAVWHLSPKGTVYTSTLTALDMSSGARLDASASDFSINGNINSVDSIVDLSGIGATAGQTFTINGNYIASGDARLLVDTVLGDSSSVSDVLVINNGTVSGSTQVMVVNAGGLGAQTTGDGILVVETNNATIAADADFRTQANSVKAGLYVYNMVRGTASPDNWYLTSAYMPPVEPKSEPEPEPGPENPDPVTPAPTPQEPPTQPSALSLPNIRAEVPVYMAAPALAGKLGLAMLGTYHDRVGEDYSDVLLLPRQQKEEWCGSGKKKYRCPVAAETYGKTLLAGWARLFGETGFVGYGAKGSAHGRLDKFYRNGPSYDYDLSGFQAGMDLYRKEHASGIRDIAGVYIGYGNIDADIQAVYGGKAGTMSMDAYSFGAYWTRKGPSGWYIDAVTQGTIFDDIEGVSIEGTRMKTHGWAFTASLESGYPFALGSDWTIEPQAQLIYQHISLNDSHDQYGRVVYGGTDMFYSRIGGRLTKDWTLSNGHKVTTWARANLWHTFGDDGNTSFPTIAGGEGTLKTKLGGAWGQIGLGVSGLVSSNMRAFASGDYNMALGTGRGHSLTGRVGIKYVW